MKHRGQMDLDTTQLFAIAAALGWASGLRLYAVVFLTGLAGLLGWVTLPDGLKLLQHPLMLGASGIMLAVEFFADKIPGLDSVWDALHTVVRIPAGALLAAGVFGGDQASWTLIAALMGGTLAATSHVAKASDARGGQHLARAVFQHRPVAAGRCGRADHAVAGLGAPAVVLRRAGGGAGADAGAIVLLLRFVRALARKWRGRYSALPAA